MILKQHFVFFKGTTQNGLTAQTPILKSYLKITTIKEELFIQLKMQENC